MSAQKADFCFLEQRLGKLPWLLGHSYPVMLLWDEVSESIFSEVLSKQMRASSWWWRQQVQLGTVNWEKLKKRGLCVCVEFRLKIGKKRHYIFCQTPLAKKWQNYRRNALGNKIQFCNILGKGCAAKEWRRTGVTMPRNRRSTELQKLLSIAFHTRLLSWDSQILFSAILLAKGQSSHDLHNFF